MLWDIFSHVMDFLAEAEEQAVNVLSVIVRVVWWSLFWSFCAACVIFALVELVTMK